MVTARKGTEPGLRAVLGPQSLLNSKFRVHFGRRETKNRGYQYPIRTHVRVRLNSGSAVAADDSISGTTECRQGRPPGHSVPLTASRIATSDDQPAVHDVDRPLPHGFSRRQLPPTFPLALERDGVTLRRFSAPARLSASLGQRSRTPPCRVRGRIRSQAPTEIELRAWRRRR